MTSLMVKLNVKKSIQKNSKNVIKDDLDDTKEIIDNMIAMENLLKYIKKLFIEL